MLTQPDPGPMGCDFITILSPTASAGLYGKDSKYLIDGRPGCFIFIALPTAIHYACSRIVLGPKGARLSLACIQEVDRKGGANTVFWSILELLPYKPRAGHRRCFLLIFAAPSRPWWNFV